MDPTNSREAKQPGGVVTKNELESCIVRAIAKVIIGGPTGEAVGMETRYSFTEAAASMHLVQAILPALPLYLSHEFDTLIDVHD